VQCVRLIPVSWRADTMLKLRTSLGDTQRAVVAAGHPPRGASDTSARLQVASPACSTPLLAYRNILRCYGLFKLPAHFLGAAQPDATWAMALGAYALCCAAQSFIAYGLQLTQSPIRQPACWTRASVLSETSCSTIGSFTHHSVQVHEQCDVVDAHLPLTLGAATVKGRRCEPALALLRGEQARQRAGGESRNALQSKSMCCDVVALPATRNHR
jgi:hypothetical protein